MIPPMSRIDPPEGHWQEHAKSCVQVKRELLCVEGLAFRETTDEVARAEQPPLQMGTTKANMNEIICA